MVENYDKMNVVMGIKLDGFEVFNNEIVDLVSEFGWDGGCCCCCCVFFGCFVNFVFGCCC